VTESRVSEGCKVLDAHGPSPTDRYGVFAFVFLLDAINEGVRDEDGAAVTTPNFLLNPSHPDFGRIEITNPIPFPFDIRILNAVADLFHDIGKLSIFSNE
jgi:hypothetical protein